MSAYYFPDNEYRHSLIDAKFLRNSTVKFGKNSYNHEKRRSEEIVIVSSNIEYVPRELKIKFPRFQSFAIYDSIAVDVINETFFEIEFDLIREFSIVGDAFKSRKLQFKPRALKKLPNLSDFFMKWFRVEILDENMFDSNENLRKIILFDNNIQKIPKRIFHRLEKLEAVSFSTNQVQYIPEGLFENNSNLREICLRKNRIFKVPPPTFKNLKKLENVNLKNNFCINEDFFAKKIGLLNKRMKQCFENWGR